MRSGQESAVLVRIPVHGVIQKIRSNRAVVQQPYCLFPALHTPQIFFPSRFAPIKNPAASASSLLTCSPKRDTSPGAWFPRFFSRAHFRDLSATGFGPIFRMPPANPQRPAMRWQFLNVEERYSVSREKFFRRDNEKSTTSVRGKSYRTGFPPSAAAK